MRLYRVQAECRNPKCGHRYLDWVTEAQRALSLSKPPHELLGVQRCPVQRCGDDIPILARHVREAEFDAGRTERVGRNPLLRNLHLRPELATPALRLTERQSKVCTLILEGMTDRAIAKALFLSKPTIRKELRAIASILCADEPVACRVFPRQTIVAFHTTRAGLLSERETT
jgi:DNA-binding CsgD family transcriptional regulator